MIGAISDQQANSPCLLIADRSLLTLLIAGITVVSLLALTKFAM